MYDFGPILLLVGLLFLLSPVLAIVALVKVSNLSYEITRLQRALRRIQDQLPDQGGQAAPPQAKAPAAPAVPARKPASPRTVAEMPPEEEAPTPEKPATQPPQPPAGEPTAPPGEPSPPPYKPEWKGPATGAPFKKPAPSAAREGLEEKLFRYGFVYVGGIAVALSVVYMVRYSMEMGWLGPAVRCILGALLGILLIAGGEVMRRHPILRAGSVVKPSQVPPGLTAAGVSALFISIFAAYGLYELLPPIVAFLALGAVWVLAMLLSILQGPFVAALGILGGYLVPILVQTGHPSAYGLFPYLLAVNGAALGVLRYKGWGWLAWGALAGAAGWPFLWLVAQPAADVGAPIVGAYLTATAALFIYVPAGQVPHNVPLTLKALFRNFPLPAILAWVASGLMLVLAVLLALADNFGWGSVAWAGILAAFLAFAGRRDATYDALSIGAGIMVSLILLSWNVPLWAGSATLSEGFPQALLPFALTALGYAGLFGIGGFGLLRGAARPGLWAGLSAGVPVVILAIAYARIANFHTGLSWAAMGLLLAALNLGAAMMVGRLREAPGMNGALAAYAVGVVGAVSLAMAVSMENAWLTVALSLQLPAIGWVHERTRVGPLRAVAMVLAMVVLVRLVFNPAIFEYGLTATPGLNWMLYGYGIPTIAFYVASRLFRRLADDALVLALESGAVVFLTLFCTFEIADIVQGGAIEPGDSLLEASLRSIAWLTISLALLYQCRAAKPRQVAVWGWQILALLAGGHILAVQLIGLNPIFQGSVGPLWIVNLLLLAYAAPALFAILFYAETRRQGHVAASAVAGISALVLTFVWITLEVRHAFHGSVLWLGGTSDGEWYAYSGAWLFYGAVLLVLGIWRGSIAMRRASMAVLILSVCKVFLFDMSETAGLYRVGSLLLLGLSLFLLSLIYTRFVKTPSEPPPE